jgi:glycosyltransferase involved in cell wall biosynthesis
LEDVKGHDYILQAAEMLRDVPEIKIIIAGGGKLEAALRQKADKLPNCVFTGFVKEIYKIENIMDLQLNASYGTEATSLSLLEGMSLGIPAVVSDFGGNPYVIQHGKNGLVVPKKEAKPLADAILKLYKDKALYDKLSADAAKIFDEKFTSKAMTANIEAVYNELLDRKR